MTVARHEPSSNSTMRPTSAPASQHFMHDVGDRILHEGRGVVEELDLHALRRDLLGARDHLLDPIDHVEGRGLRALHRDDDDGLFALHQHCVLLHPAHELHRGDVAQIDECVAFSLDRDIVEMLNLQR